MNRILLISVIFVGGAAVGAAVTGALHRVTEPSVARYTMLYYSDFRPSGEISISIAADGTTVLGPKYDRATEARKLFEAVRAMNNGAVIPDCHETIYRHPEWDAPRDGVARVYAGQANPPPPRIEWNF